jgi:hypothetical protein
MSAADADAYRDSVIGTRLPRGALVIFIDFHEDFARKGTSFLAAINSVALKDFNAYRVVRCNLHTGDVIIARVVDRNATASMCYETLDTNVSIDGSVVPSDLLADPVADAMLPVLVYERKTITDLVSSVQSKSSVPGVQHFADQKLRLRALCDLTGARPRLLLEGFMTHIITCEPVGNMTEDALHSLLSRLDLKYGISVWHSANAHDSARLVLKDARFLHTYAMALPELWYRLPLGPNDVLRVSVRKADNHNAAFYFRSVLGAVPMMGEAAVAAIADVYPNIPALVAALAADDLTEKARVKLLSELRVGSRRLGDALAKRVISFYGPQSGASAAPEPPASSSSKEEEEKEVVAVKRKRAASVPKAKRKK